MNYLDGDVQQLFFQPFSPNGGVDGPTNAPEDAAWPQSMLLPPVRVVHGAERLPQARVASPALRNSREQEQKGL